MKVYVGLCLSNQLTTRHGVKLQRRWTDIAQNAATSCLSKPERNNVSRSHCRGICGAAVIGADQLIGFDIEYTDPRRNWPAILSRFCDDKDLTSSSAQALCKGWTYLEAYFKAFGTYPEPKELLEVINAPNGETEGLTSTHFGWRYHMPIADEFFFTVLGQGHINGIEILPIITAPDLA